MAPDHFTLPMDLAEATPRDVALDPGAVLLGGFARARDAELLSALTSVIDASAFRHMVPPGGWSMSVTMTNCGNAGWVTDRTGYRYDPIDPETRQPWPPMPDV